MQKRDAFVMLAAVSDAAQKVGGEETHPIERDKGTATSCCSPSYFGINTASFGALSGSKKR